VQSSVSTLPPPPSPFPPPGVRAGARRGPLTILFLTVFLDLVGFGIVIPLLPLYAERFGASALAVAWLLAVYSLMQFLFAPTWGRLSDRFGRRPILLVGLAGSAGSYLLLGLAGSFAALFAARALAGIAGANVGVAQAYIADVTPPEERTRGMGILGAAFGLGFILGPAIGGTLAHVGTPATPFLAAGALAALNGALALRWLPESLPYAARRAYTAGFRGRMRGVALALSSRRLAPLYAAAFLVTFAFSALETTFALFAHHRLGLTAAAVAFWFVYLGVLATVVQGGLVGPLARRLGEGRLAALGAGLLAGGLLGIPLARGGGELALALAAVAAGQGLVTPSLSALLTGAADPESRGRLLGVSQSLSALARVAGPIAAGLAFVALGAASPYLGAAVVALAAMVVVLLLRPEPLS
jgi:MFS transporter, DHA1 family, tetracycline resistance protein